MSSHSVKLAKALQQFRDLQMLHSENVTNEYSRGIYNGLEWAWSIMNQKAPKYMNKKDKAKSSKNK